MATTSNLQNPSVLAFERKLDCSDGLFYAGRWEERDRPPSWSPVILREKSVRGTISNRLNAKDQDPTKLDASIQSPNLQRVDTAMLPPDADTLRLTFGLRVLPGLGRPSACDNAAYQRALQKVITAYVKTHGYSELSRRYAYNLANGRFLWRNRLCADDAEIMVRIVRKHDTVPLSPIRALDLPLREFPAVEAISDDLKTLALAIEQGFGGEEPVFLEVTAFARVGFGQEVYPSQELILDQGGTKKGKKSKTLYSVDQAAALHSQKIGNALRTIDTWYPEADELDIGPIAVEPYGSVTSRGTAYRQPKQKMDFYSLLDNWVLKDAAPEAGQQHYVMATLIRGGVFGEKQE